MFEKGSKFQIPASNTVAGVAETRIVLQCEMVKICMSFKGNSEKNDLNQNSVWILPIISLLELLCL